MPAPIKARTLVSTIANGGNLGTAIDLADAEVAGIIIDALWDAGGDELGFKVSTTYEDAGFVPLYDAGVALVSYGVTASRSYSGAALSAVLAPWRYVKAWSQDGSGNNAVQTGGSLVTFLLK